MDNSGFVRAHRKGSSRDAYIWTLAKFMEDFCKGLGVKIKLFHTGWRTSMGERVPDAFSMGNNVLERLIHDPRVDRDLARRALREVARIVDMHIWRDYVLEMEEILRDGRLEVEGED